MNQWKQPVPAAQVHPALCTLCALVEATRWLKRHCRRSGLAALAAKGSLAAEPFLIPQRYGLALRDREIPASQRVH
jgi:hypothetical protein